MMYPLGLTDLRLVFVYFSLFNLFQVLRLKGRKESDLSVRGIGVITQRMEEGHSIKRGFYSFLF